MGQSRNEEILESMIAGTEYTKVPQSREEYLLLLLKRLIDQSSAVFRGTFQSVAALNAYTGEKDLNDYAFVETQDTYGNKFYDRYTWNGTAWSYEYKVNNNSFTDDQFDAINSGANTTNIAQITTNTTAISNLGTASAKNVPVSGNASTTEVVMGDDSRLTDARQASDVYSWAKAQTKPSYSYSEIVNTPTVDATPTQNSTNAVQSGGVYTEITAINSTIGDINTVLEEVL